MQRRDFLKFASVLPILPLSFKEERFSFWIEPTTNYGWFSQIRISKDGHVSHPAGADFADLVDCHSLNAGDEMVDILIRYLEYPEFHYNFYPKPPYFGPRRCEVTMEEKRRLFAFIDKRRKQQRSAMGLSNNPKEFNSARYA